MPRDGLPDRSADHPGIVRGTAEEGASEEIVRLGATDRVGASTAGFGDTAVLLTTTCARGSLDARHPLPSRDSSDSSGRFAGLPGCAIAHVASLITGPSSAAGAGVCVSM